MGSDNAFLAVEEGMFSFDDAMVPYGPGSRTDGFNPGRSRLPVGAKRYTIPKGWRVNGVFTDGDTMHGLVYNPHIETWFHLWWNRQGKCLTGNCHDGQYDLILP